MRTWAAHHKTESKEAQNGHKNENEQAKSKIAIIFEGKNLTGCEPQTPPLSLISSLFRLRSVVDEEGLMKQHKHLTLS